MLKFSLRSKNALVLTASAFFVFSANAFAQAPVVSREAVPSEAPSTNSALQTLVELQTLREEISTLRGVIESLEYKVVKLERQQNGNYQDLDGRVSALYQNSISSTPVNQTVPADTVNNANSTVPLNNNTSSGIIPLSDFDVSSSGANAESKLVYERGFSALRKGDRDNAITEFTTIVESYPNSTEMADSLYWLGQTYWLANKREESRQSFVRLLDSFPDYRKAGDAMYRLGIIYDQLDDTDTAYDYMRQVLLSGSSQVSAAQAWIDENTSTAAN